MTPSEFKAWFDGFVEALPGTPTEAQWTRIKARVAEIDGRPITEHVYIHRYQPNWYYGVPYYGNTYGSSGFSLSNGTGIMCNSGSLTVGATSASHTGAQPPPFDSHAAMLALGRAEVADGIAGSN